MVVEVKAKFWLLNVINDVLEAVNSFITSENVFETLGTNSVL